MNDITEGLQTQTSFVQVSSNNIITDFSCFILQDFSRGWLDQIFFSLTNILDLLVDLSRVSRGVNLQVIIHKSLLIN